MYALRKYKKAFTLAEALITLIVLGIIAIESIPALIQSFQNTETTAKVKKYTSVLNQDIQLYAASNDCIGNLAGCDAFTGNANPAGYQQMWDALKPYLRIIKDCGTAASQGCYPPGVMYKLLNGSDYYVVDNSSYAKAQLADGSSLRVGLYGGNCTTDYSRSNQTPLRYTCGYIGIDINGYKGPNQLGRDVFYWWITKAGTVIPVGTSDDSTYSAADGTPDCDPNNLSVAWESPGAGRGCAARILKENAVTY
ncbi:MAG: hypothetical protein A2Y25_04090 [Candidatus Melainabacteria bacterium GWF2_37_15]|nr:MAG: hypothetical protein A2Y25_04090 [Candidatus Melainabacteria bacterium GWF2_37_15]